MKPDNLVCILSKTSIERTKMKLFIPPRHVALFLLLCIGIFLVSAWSPGVRSDLSTIYNSATEGYGWNSFNFDWVLDPSNIEATTVYVDDRIDNLHIPDLGEDERTFHLFSHGRSGELLINGEWKDSKKIAQWIVDQQLNNSTIQQFNIYGCNFAKGKKGKEAVSYLEAALGVSISASDDITGIDGDWDLEVGDAQNSIQLLDYASNLQVKGGALPIERGMAVVSCASRTGANGNTNPSGPVLAIFDIREPNCPAPDGPGPTPNLPSNWDDASDEGKVYHGPGSAWTAANLGEVFGVDLEYDVVTAPDIFVGACGLTELAISSTSKANNNMGSGGEIFRINGSTGAVTTLVSLPNATFESATGFEQFVGLGNVTYNADAEVVYATNLSDGNIYVVHAITGMPLDTLDPTPTVADIPARNHTQEQRYVYGIEYNRCDGRLYYAKPDHTTAASAYAQQIIYSIGVNSDGTLDDSDIDTEFTIATENDNQGFISDHIEIITDIEFSNEDCSQMLLAGRSINTRPTTVMGGYTIGFHRSKTYRYDLSGGSWTPAVLSGSASGEYFVGEYTGGPNSRKNASGGVAFGHGNYGDCGETNAIDDAMVATADAITFDGMTPNFVYGLQISDINGTGTAGNGANQFPQNSYGVDIDDDLTIGADSKVTAFDVDIFGEISTDTFDLALRKTLDIEQFYNPGDTVLFTIFIFNQGNIGAADIEVIDYIPTLTNYVHSSSTQSGTLTSGSGVMTAFMNNADGTFAIDTLPPSDSVSFTLALRISPMADPILNRTFYNNAEIIDATGGIDQDSIIDPNNPVGMMDDFSEVDTDNDIDDDGPGTPGTMDNPNDADQYDVAVFRLQPLAEPLDTFDLALRKTLSTSGPFAPGDLVTFNIEVFNQGNVAADTIEITDYIPAGLILNDPNWMQVGMLAQREIYDLAAGDSTSVSITFTISNSFTGTITNWAEISRSTNTLNEPDIDSTPDGQNFNTDGETNDLNDDNIIDEDGMNGGDEDDHDPAEIVVTCPIGDCVPRPIKVIKN